MKILLGITGASGSLYARRMLAHLSRLGVEVLCTISDTGRFTWKWELGEEFEVEAARWENVKVYPGDDYMSPMASGSFRHDGMAVVPCSMRTVGGLASGMADGLLQRAAEVCLKERRKLVLVVRETPYALTHLENMTRVTRAGAVVMPASPGFYHRPGSVVELVDFVLARVLDHLGVENDLSRRWGDGARGEVTHE